MINIEKIKYEEPIYYVPTYAGAEKVKVIKLTDANTALVQSASRPESKPFTRKLGHIYNDQNAALRGKRSWEASVRKVKKNRKREKYGVA